MVENQSQAHHARWRWVVVAACFHVGIVAASLFWLAGWLPSLWWVTLPMAGVGGAALWGSFAAKRSIAEAGREPSDPEQLNAKTVGSVLWTIPPIAGMVIGFFNAKALLQGTLRGYVVVYGDGASSRRFPEVHVGPVARPAGVLVALSALLQLEVVGLIVLSNVAGS